jgi:cephalosporin hydroxylase
MADVLRACGLNDSMVVTVELDVSKIEDVVKRDNNIIVYEGSSVDSNVFKNVKFFVESFCKDAKVMVILDSDHTKEHVLKELELYAPLVSPGSILIVEDTIINGHPVEAEHGPGPLEAVEEWELDHPEFELNAMCEKLMLTFNRGGYFERKADK